MAYRIAYQRCQWEARPPTDVPAAGSLESSITDEGTLRISGWALGRDSAFERMEVRSSARVVELSVDEPSPDVAALTAGVGPSDNCRFAVELPLDGLAAGELEWTVWALGDGIVMRHFGTLLLEPERLTARPVFVLGAARSGTTAVGNGVRAALGLQGYGECHTLPLLAALVGAVHTYYDSPNPASAARQEDVLLSHVGAEEWQARVTTAMRSVYANLHPGGSFVDKTPGTQMLESLQMLMSVWPDARVVFTRRRGLENVESRRRKFREQEFVGHCHDWTSAMTAWQDLKEAVPESQRMEVDQYDLASDPVATGDRLASFLALEPPERQALHDYLATNAPERTSADWDALELDELAWSPEERAQFLEICGPTMRAFGYTLDRAYRGGGGSPAAPEGPGPDESVSTEPGEVPG